MPSPNDTAIQFLVSSQLISGGWGYKLKTPAVVEPTAAGVLALRKAPAAEQALQRAVKWLLDCQNPDGGWGICPEDSESGWSTAWAVLALQRTGYSGPEVGRGIRWLLDEDVMQYTDSSLLSEGTKIAKIDFSIRGWPWLPGQASWVEPTALAMLALESARDQTEVKARLDEAVRYLKDRRVPGGGWNVGNPVMFESVLPARVHTTSWGLMALQVFSKETILPEDLGFLRAEMSRDSGPMGLAWGSLALSVLGQEDALMKQKVASLQQADGGWEENPYLSAVSLLTLGGGW